MSNPNDDPDVISGLCDDAKKEMATTPGTSQGAGTGEHHITQYVDEGRVGGACLHAETRASLMEGERTRWAGPGTRAI